MLAQTQLPVKWIVIDNSTHDEHDWSVCQSIPWVDYVRVREKQTIGELRNICLEKALAAGAEYIVFWDDDDYYPPTRISMGVKSRRQVACLCFSRMRMHLWK